MACIRCDKEPCGCGTPALRIRCGELAHAVVKAAEEKVFKERRAEGVCHVPLSFRHQECLMQMVAALLVEIAIGATSLVPNKRQVQEAKEIERAKVSDM